MLSSSIILKILIFFLKCSVQQKHTVVCTDATFIGRIINYWSAGTRLSPCLGWNSLYEYNSVRRPDWRDDEKIISIYAWWFALVLWTGVIGYRQRQDNGTCWFLPFCAGIVERDGMVLLRCEWWQVGLFIR